MKNKNKPYWSAERQRFERVYPAAKSGPNKGKRKQVRIRDEAKFEAECARIEEELANGRDFAVPQLFDYWAEQFLKDRIEKFTDTEGNVNLKRIQDDDIPMVNVLLGKRGITAGENRNLNVPSFGGINVEDIREQDIQEFFRQMAICNPHTGRPTSQSTLRKYRRTLRMILSKALKAGAITVSPLDSDTILKPGAPEKERKSLTAFNPQLPYMILDTPGDAQIPLILGMLLNMRPGELFVRTWLDFDEFNGVLLVNTSRDYSTAVPGIKKGGKTKKATRTIHLSDATIDFLVELREQSAGPYIVANKDEPMSPLPYTTWRSQLKRYKKTLQEKYGEIADDFDDFTLYSTRHEAASLLDAARVDATTQQNEFGDNIKMISHYAQREEQIDRENMMPYHELVDKRFGEGLRALLSA